MSDSFSSALAQAGLSPGHAGAPEPGSPEMGRPTLLDERMLTRLLSIIRETGVSDSGAASRAGVHPSTVSRWKRDCPEFAIVLRASREEFRQAHLNIIQREAESGRTGWRASAWILERVFPEDYSPRAKERAKFQEMYEARCAAECAGEEEEGETDGTALDRGEALQNLRKPAPVAPRGGVACEEAAAALADSLTEVTLDAARKGEATSVRFPRRPLQNVQKSPLAGPIGRQGVARDGGRE